MASNNWVLTLVACLQTLGYVSTQSLVSKAGSCHDPVTVQCSAVQCSDGLHGALEQGWPVGKFLGWVLWEGLTAVVG